jgi:hypothetical protein
VEKGVGRYFCPCLLERGCEGKIRQEGCCVMYVGMYPTVKISEPKFIVILWELKPAMAWG